MAREGEAKGRKLPLLPSREKAGRKNPSGKILARICFRKGGSSCSPAADYGLETLINSSTGTKPRLKVTGIESLGRGEAEVSPQTSRGRGFLLETGATQLAGLE